MRSVLISALLLVALGGCAAVPKTPGADLADLRAFTEADIAAALARATARGDVPAMTCYPEVAKAVASAGEATPPQGALDAFEAVRLIVRPPVPPNDALLVACAALAQQTAVDVIKFDLKVAGMVGSGGATAVPQAIPALTKLLALLRALGVGR